MERFNDELQLALQSGYEVRKGIDDDGKSFFHILCGGGVDNDGEAAADCRIAISLMDGSTISEENVNLRGNFPASLQCESQEQNLIFYNVHVICCAVGVSNNNRTYLAICTEMCSKAEDVSSKIEMVARHMTVVVNSMVLDGQAVSLESITAELFLTHSEKNAGATAEVDADFSTAEPSSNQHCQLDFKSNAQSVLQLLGAKVHVSDSGTEFSFIPVGQIADGHRNPKAVRILRSAADADKGGFPLAERAKEMSRIFRVSIDSFNDAHDREQEILGGLIQHSITFNGLRSFAWTLSAYCVEKGVSPRDVEIDTLSDITAFVEQRHHLNYTEDENCPTLCHGNDIHVYYLPDTVSEADRRQLLDIENDGVDNALSRNSIMSLEGLRKDLSYLHPAIEKIYETLQAERDPEVPLVGSEADVLYAWCATTYAAREPIFTEDGPTNCSFQHPDQADTWMKELNRQRQEEVRQSAEKWMVQHEKHITRVSNISFSGAKFVFSGMEGHEDWANVQENLKEKGGIIRTAVSGQTDYVVCEPTYSGEAKINAALAQRAKGKNVQIILAEDFLHALYSQSSKAPEEKEGEGVATTKTLVNAGKTVSGGTSDLPIQLTYSKGLRAGNEDYEIDIPDGFQIDNGAEGRDFIAWLPDKNSPHSYEDSEFIIFSGAASDLEDNFATVDEYVAIAKAVHYSISGSGMFGVETFLPSYDPALPGGMSVAFDRNVMHVNANYGVAGYKKAMRLQVSGVKRNERPAYEQLAQEVFRHMRGKEPLSLISEVDDPQFVGKPPTDALVKKWDTCISNRIEHISNSRMILQNAVVFTHKAKQAKGSLSVPKLKKDVKDMLRFTVDLLEAQVEKAYAVYQAARTAEPDNKALPKMRVSLEKLLDEADQYVRINGEEIRVTSDMAEKIRAELRKSRQPAAKKAEKPGKREGDTTVKEERRKAEEEKKKQQAMIARNEKEAKRREQAEIEQYEKEMDQYRRKMADIEENRKTAIRIEAEKSRNELYNVLKSNYDRKITKLQEQLRAAQSDVTAAEIKLSSLGFFSFSQKKDVKAHIQAALETIDQTSDEISRAKEEYKSSISNLSAVSSVVPQAVLDEINKKYPPLAPPVKPESVRKAEQKAAEEARLEEQRRTELMAREEEERRKNPMYMKKLRGKETLVNYLSKQEWHTVLECMNALRTDSSVFASSILHELLKEGKVERKKEDGCSYYRLL